MYEKCDGCIIRLEDMAWIPMDEMNTDYIQFLSYLSENDLKIENILNYENK